MKSQTAAKQTDQRPFMEEMERRLLMSADVFGAFAANAVYQDVEQPESESALVTESDQAVAAEAAEHQSRELIIIDAATPDYESLLADLTGNAEEDRLFEVAVLDPTEDGITQVGDLLSNYTGLDAVHIISHGSEGSITLGSSVLDYDTLIDSARHIEGWSDAFAADGDLLIYGCDLAASEQGQDLVDALARLTETDVAASEDLTGAASLGGDWDLEYQRGEIEARVAFSEELRQSWENVLIEVSNTNATGAGSLQQAILDANSNVGVTDTITFNIGGGGPQTIVVDAGGLPIITDSIILDATTQPGFSGTPLITLDGSATPASSGINGITLRANDSTVMGLIVINFADEGIEVDGSTGFGDNNTIQNNWVGIDAAGNVAGNAEHGIMISDNATGNQVGGTGPNEGNIVAGNGFSGIIINENSDNNVVEGNIVGLKADGTTPAGNGTHGVFVQLSSDNNRIGGAAIGAGNIISGNNGDGVNIDGTTDATFTTVVTGTVVVGNYIGTDATGNTQAGNDIQDSGITIYESYGNTIGGAGVGDANVISGNRLRGVIIEGATATNNVVSGNFIGTNADGSAALTNVGGGQQIGVYLYDAPGNTIGGPANGAENVISGNTSFGLYAWGANATGNTIQGNTIGLDASLVVAIGNGNAGGSGILLSNAPANLIGGTVAGAANVISGHLGAGLALVGAGGTGNTVLGNEIYANGALGIDLESDGVTGNDAGDADPGANDLQNFPVITSADLSGTDLGLSGTLDTDGVTTQYRIEFFGNAAGTQDATNGEARVYLGSTIVTTDAGGDATFSNVTLAGVTLSGGDYVTATATKIDDPGQLGINDQLAYGATSEFATNLAVVDINDAPVIHDWYNAAWDFRKSVNIDAAQVAADLSDFPVLITLNADPELVAAALANGDDILFTSADGVTKLAHEIQSYDSLTGALTVWVKTDLSATLDTQLFMYFGNGGASNQQDAVNVWDANYVGVYHLNDSPTGTPGEITDSTSNNNHGTTEGSMDAADLVDAQIGKGLDFDEVDDLIRIPDSVSLDSTAAKATFELWAWFDNAADGDTQIIMSSSNRYSAIDGYEWASQGSGNHFFYPDATSPDGNYNLGPNPFTNQQWHHLAATMDFDTKEVIVYVDGTPMAFSYEGVPGMWASLTSSDDLLFGGNPDRMTRFFDGMMDEIRISNVVRSQEWIQTSINNQSSPGAFFTLGSAENRDLSLTNINEDEFASAGDTVLSIVGSGGGDRITDTDIGAVEGIAVNAVDGTNGQWQYDANDDGTWVAFGSVSDSSAVLLDVGAKIRFVPNEDYNGPAGSITFRAWDQTSGANGQTAVDVSMNGGSTAFSTADYTASLNVNPVADAPIANADSSYLSFDGDDYIQIADDASLQMTNNLTMEVWISHSGNGTGSQIILNKEGEYELGITAETGEIKFAIANGPTWNWHNTGHFVTANEWTHVAVTYDAVAGVANTYINGTLVDTYSQSGPVSDVYPAFNDLFIGGRENATTQRFQGLIDDVRVWNTTRSDTDIANNFSSPLTGAEAGLAGAWLLDQAAGTLTVDLSPNGNDGTLGGLEGASATPTYQGYFTNEDTPLNVPALTGVLANDYDAEDDTLTVTELDGNAADIGVPATLASGAQITLNSDGSFVYDPNGQFDYLDVGQSAKDSFSYTVSDGNGGTDTATVTIAIIGANDAPVITSDGGAGIANVNVAENSTTVTTVTSSDADSGAPFYSISGGADAAMFSIDSAGGELTFNAAPDFEFPADNDGDNVYVVTVQVADGQGGFASQTINVTVTDVDEVAPVVTVNSISTADNTPQLGGTVDDPTATVQVTVNGTTYAATNNGDGTWTLADDTIAPALADGTYDVSVTATDGVGNVGTDGSLNELTVDTTAPVVTVTGLTTADNTPQLSGTVNDPAATVQVTVNGATYAATNNGDGTWTLADDTIAPALADGTYDVSVTATDALSNVGTDASTNELTVDTTAPIVTVTGLTTADNTPQLTGTVNDLAATVQVTVNGTTYAATNNGDGTWTLADDTIAPALADGTYDVSVTATDALSNVGTDASTNELTVDTTAPVVTITGLTTADNTPQLTGTVNDLAATVQVTVNGTTYAATNNGDGTWTLADDTIAPALADGTYDVSVTATDALSNVGTDASTNELTVDTTAPIVTVTGLTTADNTPQLTGTVNDPAATVQVTVNGTTYAATNNGDGTWTLADDTIAPALADGTYDVSVTATDGVGNVGTDGSVNELTVDTTAPVVTVTGLTTADNTPALTGTVSDPTATVQVTVNGTTYAATNNGDGTWTLADDTIGPALADGTYDVSVTATDSVGNVGSDASIDELVVDTTAPVVTVTSLNTADATPQLTGTVSDPTATVQVTVNGTTYTATNNGDGTWTLADDTIAPALADGTYDVSVTATDALSNVGTDASTNELTVDTTAPVVTITGLTTADNTPALTGTVSDPTATVQVTVNGTTYAATNNGDGTWTLADDTIAPALADGTYDVAVTATDGLGNVDADASTNELTVDTAAPVVTVTGLSTADNTPALTGTVSDPSATVQVTVNGTTYTATNNGDGTWTLADDSIAPALADGIYDVSVTATDGVGNVGTDASIDELVVDTAAPIVTVTGLTTADNTPALTGTVSDPTATVQVTVNGTTYTATNNGDGTWTLADDSIAPALADGTYDVSVTATDGVGNVGADASVDELVVDTTAPVVTVTGLTTADNTPALTGTVSDPSATVQVTVNGTTYTATNNGDGTWTLADDTIGPALADGTYDVSVTATDSVGNVGSDASIDELVVDTTAPVVTVTSLNTADATPQLTGTVSDPTATVQVTVNGTTYTATNNGDGTWTLADDTIAPALADGTYDVSVTATDALSNVGTDASTNELTVDTTAPVVTITGLTTADNTPALTGTVSDPTATVQVTVNGATYAATNNGDGTWTLADDTIAPALADGTYDVSVTATDGVGNVGTDGSVNELTVDTTAPVVSVTGLTTADNTPALTGTVSDPTATVQVTVNGTTYAATNNGDGTWTLVDDTIAPALADGTYDVSVTATDGVGNVGTDGSVNELTVDTTAPVVSVTGLATADNTPALTGTVSDPTATVQVTVNGSTYTATNNGDGTWTLADNSIAPALADGTYDVAVTATDAVGNVGADASIDELVVDTTAPVVTVSGLTTLDSTPALTGTVNDPTATVQVTVNGTTYTATNNGDGTWTLADNSIAPALAKGTYDVVVTATDALGNIGTDASVDELVILNAPPVAGDDAITTDEDLPFTAVLGLDDLLLNDSDADGDPLTVNTTPVSGPSNGTLVLNSDGTFTYTPNADFNGTDSFVYEVSDGDGGIAQATVTITVNPINDGPTAVADGYTTNEDQPVTAVLGVDDLLLNDSDTEGDPLTVNTTPVSGPGNGTLVLNSDGTFTYTPDADFNGTDSFTYEISDGNGGTSQAVVTIVVNADNDAPTTSGIADVTVDEDAPNTTIDLLGAFGDVEDGAGGLTFTVAANTDSGLFNSTFINDLAGNITLVYAANANGTADITIRATDTAGAWVETTFTVTVTPVNDAPVVGSESITVDEDVSFLAALGVDDLLLNESDVEGDVLSVNTTPVAGPANGTVLLNSDGTFTYTPNADFNGTDSFTYEVADGNGGISQGVVTITVNPVNDAPVLGDESMAVDEDAALAGVAGISDLLMNDTDVDGDPLSVSTTPVSGPTNGTLVLNSDGTFTYTPDADFNGADSFSYQVSDGSGGTSQAVVTIAVNPMNDAPVAASDAISVDNLSGGSFSQAALLANDADVDGDTLQIVGFTQPAQGSLTQNPDGSFAYTPVAAFTGIDSFTYTVADVAGAQDTVLVMVSVVEPTLINPDGPPDPDPVPDIEEVGGPPDDQEDGDDADKDTGDDTPEDEPAGDGTPGQEEEPPLVDDDTPDGAGPLETVLKKSLLDLYGQSDDGAGRTGVTAPKFLYDALQAVETTFDVAIPDMALAAVSELPIWKALDAMRREMGSPAEDAQFGGIMVTQMTTGASLVLSAGFVSWILRGGALASALLSSMPMWKGFDPLPILLARKKRKKDAQARAERDAKILRESEVDRLFEAASHSAPAGGRGRSVK